MSRIHGGYVIKNVNISIYYYTYILEKKSSSLCNLVSWDNVSLPYSKNAVIKRCFIGLTLFSIRNT